ADVIGYRGRAGDRRIHGGICRGNGNGAVGWGFSQGAGRVMGRGRRVSDLLLAASCEEKSSHQPEAQRQLHGESLAPRREKSKGNAGRFDRRQTRKTSTPPALRLRLFTSRMSQLSKCRFDLDENSGPIPGRQLAKQPERG